MKAFARVYGPSLHLTHAKESLGERKFLETDPDYLFLKTCSPKKGLPGSHTGLFRIHTDSPSSTKEYRYID